MNREIKFRTWSKTHNTFLNNTKDWPFLLTPTGNVCEWDGGCWTDSNWENYKDNTDEYQKTAFVVQQYTGIKDKNGKEIYEGDVVQYKVKRTDVSKVTEQLEIKTITFSNGRFSPFPEKICYPDYTDYESYDFEVIGHIFEN